MHPQVLVELSIDGRQARFWCDEAIADILVACWLLNMPTVMSCQANNVAGGGEVVWIHFASDQAAAQFVRVALAGGPLSHTATGLDINVRFPIAELAAVRDRLGVEELMANHSAGICIRARTGADDTAERVSELQDALAIVSALETRTGGAQCWLHSEEHMPSLQVERNLAGKGELLREYEAVELALEDLNDLIDNLLDGIVERIDQEEGQLD